jgi:hypothetical protein
MILPLKRTLSVTMVLISILLAGLLALGIRQYQLHRHHQEIIRQTEQLLFQFSLIREHIVESLLSGRVGQLHEASREVETFHANVARVMENTHIPDDYKLTFAGQVDLPGLVLLLRNPEEPRKPEASERLNHAVRVLGERLTLFDRLVLNHAKRQLVDFQTTVIGILALTVVGLIMLLFFGYRRLAVPLFALMGQVREVREGKRSGIAAGGSWHEVRTLALLVDEPLREVQTLARRQSRQQHLLQMIREVLKQLSETGSIDDLYRGISKALLANHDYCLAWIGMPEPAGGNLLPVVVDGSSIMSSRECQECMVVLLGMAKEQDEEQNQALSAYRTGCPVLRQDILAGVPKGPFRNTPLAEGKLSCVSLPIRKGEMVLGVLNLYSLQPEVFGAAEQDLLLRLLDLVATVTRSLDREAARRAAAASGRLLSSPETAGELALEINNLCNGIINYAQVLTDELGNLGPEEQSGLLARIIKEGERIAVLTRPLLASELD